MRQRPSSDSLRTARLDAPLRVGGLSDDEAERLPFPIDRQSLARMEISTWRTDAGDLDVLIGIPDRNGRVVGLRGVGDACAAVDAENVPVIVVALDDLTASKEWADILIAAASRTECPGALTRGNHEAPGLEHPPDGGHRRHGGVAAGQLGVDGQRSGVDAEVGQLPVGVAAMLPSFVGFSVFVPRTSTTK